MINTMGHRPWLFLVRCASVHRLNCQTATRTSPARAALLRPARTTWSFFAAARASDLFNRQNALETRIGWQSSEPARDMRIWSRATELGDHVAVEEIRWLSR